MAVIETVEVLSDQQVAAVVSKLARGGTPAQVATATHLPVDAVEEVGRLHGWPSIADLTRASKQLAKALRDASEGQSAISPKVMQTIDRTDDVQEGKLAPLHPLQELAAPAESERPEYANGGPVPPGRFIEVNSPGCLTAAFIPEASPTMSEQHEGGEDAPEPAEQPAGVAEEPSIPPAPNTDPSSVSWFGPGPRTIDRLLGAARQAGTPAMLEIVAAIEHMANELVDLVEMHEDRRAKLEQELALAETRVSELRAALAEISGTPLARPQLTVVPDPGVPAAPAPDKGLWLQLTTEVRRQVLPWAIEHGVQHAAHGRQPAVTVAAFLAAHPDLDPRR